MKHTQIANLSPPILESIIIIKQCLVINNLNNHYNGNKKHLNYRGRLEY